VQVVAARQAGRVAAADHLSASHAVADLDVERHQVPVERLHAEAMIDDDAVTVDAEPAGVDDGAGGGGGDRHVLRNREVEAEVRLLIDLFALVDVRPPIGEAGLDLRVAELEERAVPQFFGAVFAASAAICSALILRSSPFTRRNPASISGLSCAGAVIFSSGECSMISGTTRLMNLSSISIRLFLNGFSNALSMNVAFA
jgi:hypothetical protein